MRGARRAALLALVSLLALAGCENALQTFVFDTLFGPPYRHHEAMLVPPAPNPNTGNLGQAVDISGDYMIAGAPAENSERGAAYIFHRTDAGGWDAGARITASDAADYDAFGSAVAISGEWAVVGAPAKDVDSDREGAIYIFHRTGTTTWDAGIRTTLVDLGAGAEPIDRFGFSVSIDGTWIAAGARQDDLDTGNANDNFGAVYVFKYDAGSWVFDSPALNLGTAAAKRGANFGYAVDIAGDQLIVGAHYEDIDGSGTSPLKQGAAYIYQYIIDSWVPADRLVAPDAESDAIFGASVSISGNYAIVGSPWKSEGGQTMAGAAYIFQKTSATDWHTITPQKLSLAAPAVGDWFGFSTAIRGDFAMVGAVYRDEAATGAGASYLYTRQQGNSWNLLSTLTASDTAAGNRFLGASVAFSDTRAVVGATDPAAVGGAGAVYILK